MERFLSGDSEIAILLKHLVEMQIPPGAGLIFQYKICEIFEDDSKDIFTSEEFKT